MMLALLRYAYCEGERSSRRIERRCREDIAFRVLSANQLPDHATICRFRQRHEQPLAGLFVEVLRLCAEAGLAPSGLVALDGTKLRANASRERNRTAAQLAAEVERMLAEAEQADAEEQADSGSGATRCRPRCAAGRSGWRGCVRRRRAWRRANRSARTPTKLELREREQKDARGRIPDKLSTRERMRRTLTTKRGRRLYEQRRWMIEPVFGEIKENRCIRRFQRRGVNACASEWKLIGASHNLRKLYRHRQPRRPPAPAGHPSAKGRPSLTNLGQQRTTQARSQRTP